jgi:hypothetical protein
VSLLRVLRALIVAGGVVALITLLRNKSHSDSNMMSWGGASGLYREYRGVTPLPKASLFELRPISLSSNKL